LNHAHFEHEMKLNLIRSYAFCKTIVISFKSFSTIDYLQVVVN